MKRGSIFETDGIPRMSEALPLAMQHVVAMIVGCVTPAIIVSGAVPGGLSREDQVILIQSALVIAALATLLQLFPIGGKAKFAIGSGLPIIMGVSFAYVPSMQAIAESYGIAAIMGAEIVAGSSRSFRTFLTAARTFPGSVSRSGRSSSISMVNG